MDNLEITQIANMEPPPLPFTSLGETKTLEYNLVNPCSLRAIDEAFVLGLDVVFPEPNQLQLDIDNSESYELFQRLRNVVEYHYGVERVEEHPSKSGYPKLHITITLKRNVSNVERILLQACLGSDRVREMLSLIQETFGDPHPTLFLEKKGLNGEV